MMNCFIQLRNKGVNNYLSIWVMSSLVFMFFHGNQTLAQNKISPDSVIMTPSSADTTRKVFGCKITNFKMGYGGLELGYVFFPGNKVNIGGSLLFAAGAAFWQNQPKSDGEKLFDNDFKIFPVVEPSLYGELVLNRFMRLHGGISYRFVSGSDLEYIKGRNMRDFSFYVGLLLGKL